MVGIRDQPETYSKLRAERKGLQKHEKTYYFVTPYNDNDSNSRITATPTKTNRCYQCLLFCICAPMLFQRKRKSLLKRLWRARTPLATNSNSHYGLILDPVHCQNTDTEGGGGSVFLDCCGPSVATANISNNSSTCISIADDQECQRRYQMFLNLVKNLEDKQLDTLRIAVDNTNNNNNNNAVSSVKTDCVLIPKGRILGLEPHVVACQTWRWSDLRSSSELKRIPSCSSERDPIYVCCNPAHWSRIYEPGK